MASIVVSICLAIAFVCGVEYEYEAKVRDRWLEILKAARGAAVAVAKGAWQRLNTKAPE